MKTYLKIKLATIVSGIKSSKQAEHQALTRGRGLRGQWPKRHIKGEEKPSPPKDAKDLGKLDLIWFKANRWSDQVLEANGQKITQDQLQQAVDEAYEKFWGLERFRKNTLRPEARHTHLALGFLNGKRYDQIESSGCYILPDFNRIEEMIFPDQDLGDFSFTFTWENQEDIRVTKQRWAEWKDSALKALNAGVEVTVAA